MRTLNNDPKHVSSQLIMWCPTDLCHDRQICITVDSDRSTSQGSIVGGVGIENAETQRLRDEGGPCLRDSETRVGLAA